MGRGTGQWERSQKPQERTSRRGYGHRDRQTKPGLKRKEEGGNANGGSPERQKTTETWRRSKNLTYQRLEGWKNTDLTKTNSAGMLLKNR